MCFLKNTVNKLLKCVKSITNEAIVEYAKKYHYVVALIFALLFALAVISYKTVVYEYVDGDEVVLLESEKARRDTSYPDRDLLSTLGYSTYVYPKVLSSLNTTYSFQKCKYIVTFASVFLTVYFTYVALVMLEFSPFVAMGTSLVAVFPRAGPIDAFGGLLMVTGRTFALPVVWLISAWYIRRRKYGKALYPVFFATGLASYIHPASFTMFFALLMVVHLCLEVWDSKYKKAMIDMFGFSVAYAVGAFFLLMEIVKRLFIASHPIEAVSTVTVAEYVDALYTRVPFEFVMVNLAWMRHVVIVSFFFFCAAAYVLYLLRKKEILQSSMHFQIVRWSTLVMVAAFVIHIAVPGIQMYLLETFGTPYILWFFARTFKYFWLGILLLFAVALVHVLKKYGRMYAVLCIACGILSSSFFFEWFQFVVGYKNYQKEIIPVALQDVTYASGFDESRNWCTAYEAVGAVEGDMVLSDDFTLRYFCGLRPYVTHEEGTAHLFLGKESLVAWREKMLYQRVVLAGSNSESVRSYAKRVGATAAALPKDSSAVAEFIEDGNPVVFEGNYAVVGILKQDNFESENDADELINIK